MAILSNLEPKRVFEIFEEMCAIPHGSANTKAISDWCVAFGEKLGLEHYQDEANNVILIAPATPGYEDAPAVILQGHVDMVCEKEAGCAKDMDKEGLDLFVDGDLVGAKGTTLGGDDGIAVAMALAALEDTTVQHPRLEVVLTTDEEIGMLGAAVLDVTPLQGPYHAEYRLRGGGDLHRGLCRWRQRVLPSAADPGGIRRGDAGGAGVRSGGRPLRCGDQQGPGQRRCAAGAAAAGHVRRDRAASGVR